MKIRESTPGVFLVVNMNVMDGIVGTDIAGLNGDGQKCGVLILCWSTLGRFKKISHCQQLLTQ